MPPDTPQPETDVSVYDEPLHENVQALLNWGGESASLGGTLLFASFSVPRAGSYLVHVTLGGGHVTGSPVVLRVAPSEACGRLSYALGSGLEVAEAGRHETVVVWLKDIHGNARRHDDEPEK